MEVLGIWRSPIDKLALHCAESLSARQPQCSIMFNTDFELMTLYNYGSFVGSPNQTAAQNSAALASMFSKKIDGVSPFGVTTK